VLHRLTAQRLLSRSDDARDRRRAVLQLTRRGVRANEVRHGTVEAAVGAALESISDRDRAAARRVLESLAAHLAPATGPRTSPRRPVRPRPAVERSRT
jgi:DNA-binding MarR family transcriptional regulator